MNPKHLSRRRFNASLGAGLALAALAPAARAQEFPSGRSASSCPSRPAAPPT